MADFDLPVDDIDFTPLSSASLESIVLTVIVLVVGYIVVRILAGRFEHYASKNTSLPKLMLINLVKIVKAFMYIIVILIALQTLGFDVAVFILSIFAFIAIIMSFGMRDTINNLASGLWIASSRAYDINDEVTLANEHGTVVAMTIMATEIKQLDNSRVIIPNGKVWNSPIINVTRMDKRLIAISFGVAYNTKIRDAMAIALKVADTHPKLHKDPAPIVRFSDMADSAIVLQLRVWVDTVDFYQTKSDIMEMLFDNLTEAGIGIPFPQMDVHLVKEE